METKVQFGGQGRDYKLTAAILIYSDSSSPARHSLGDGGSSSSNDHVAATVHDVEHVGRGQPIIKPGQPVSIQALEHLMLSLGRQSGANFIPENILSIGLDRMAWWCPAGRRRIWFKGEKELKSLNGRFVHHPPLLFVARGGLYAFALLHNMRPKLDTTLYRAPYWNLSEGHMCNGNIRLPSCQPENIHAFESAFFNSAFTHGRGEGLTRHPGGHIGLWRELAGRKTKPDSSFWRRNLVRTNRTIKSVFTK